jgi:outer membrane protein, heavy metal efflux system
MHPPTGRPVKAALALAVFGMVACVRPAVDREDLGRRVAARTGRGLRPQSTATRVELPSDVRLDDGITDDEAVAVALWNSPLFQADLAQLGVARGDLVEAGMIRNPLLTLLFPLGPKQLELTGSIPLEWIWTRPRRVAAAELELERVAQSLVQSALDVARDARLAHAELVRARRREQLAREGLGLRKRLASIAEGRLAAGDISPTDASLTRADAAMAEQELLRAMQDREDATDRLTIVLGLDDGGRRELTPVERLEPRWRGDLGPLVAHALAARPDLRAAELAIESAAARAGWERARVLNQVAALVDANGAGKEGFEIGPGLLIELPFFYQNGGARERTRAEIVRAAWQYAAARQRIGFEVRTAHRAYGRALEMLAVTRSRVLPELTKALERTEKAFATGDVAQLLVLETSRQLLEARARAVDLEATVSRAAADLDRSVGRKIVDEQAK